MEGGRCTIMKVGGATLGIWGGDTRKVGGATLGMWDGDTWKVGMVQ